VEQNLTEVIERLRQEGEKIPRVCPVCGGKLHACRDYLGFIALWCPVCSEIVWEDTEERGEVYFQNRKGV